MKQIYNDFEYTIVHFGKYKGKFLKEVPTDYIKWVISNHADTAVATMFSIELQRRDKKFRK
jgi:uncharacterized protein (DUF3820 family)